ncbi:MAG: K+ channel TrkA-N [Micavibrio sp.]|nr:K+ channel TrkA-N [Micavibrio sp.]|tara:strand:+ start:2700 stop:3143 length:444 start_codon:yes stop_codon:yes gene_type:complete
MLLLQFALGTLIILSTVIIHALFLTNIFELIERISPLIFKLTKRFWLAILMVIAVWLVFVAHIVEIWIWAGFYLSLDEFNSFSDALYFSTSTFTTVGYGDIVLSEKWRLISSFQAANGFILFGWSTAFIFEIMSKLYKDEKIRKTGI